MSDQNTTGYPVDADKCQNCGAMKVFSALVCPVCGMSYNEAAAIKKANASKPMNFYRDDSGSFAETDKPVSKTAFDPNASFAKFKSSLENNKTSEDNAERVDTDPEKEAKPDEEIQVIQEETGKTVSLSEEFEERAADRPENNPANSGLYGERRFRIGDDLSKANIMSDKRPEQEPDQTIVPTRYGLDSETVRLKREQSLSDDAAKQKLFSSSVSQRYEQYKADRDNSPDQPAYSTPYNRGSFDVVPEEKPNILAKIIPLAAVLVLVVVAGIFIAKYINREKNENGVPYETGSFTGSEYVNNWAEIRFKFDDKMQNANSTFYSYANSVYKGLSNSDTNVELELYAIYNDSPAVIMMSFSDGSIFGMDEKEFADSDQLDALMESGENNIRIEPDMLLGSHSYKAISAETEYEKDKKMRMYMCYRKIGNRINVVFLYDVTGVTDVNTIKKYFQAY